MEYTIDEVTFEIRVYEGGELRLIQGYNPTTYNASPFNSYEEAEAWLLTAYVDETLTKIS